MDDHHLSVRDYVRARRLRVVGSIVIGGLLAAVATLSTITSESWKSRFEHVFEPLPGLLYAPPTQDVSLTTAENPVPLTFQAIDRGDAYRFNASIPVSTEPVEPATPFSLPSTLSAIERQRALNCLTQAVYYEAGSESAQGQRAVAQVILNRMRHPAFPSSVCGVVYSGSQRSTGCQFTFTCDGSLARLPSASGWARSRQVATSALSGYVEVSVGQATHYHALYVAPYWSPSLLKVANIGAHTFYRWKGLTGKRSAFVSPYAGREPVVSGRTAPEAEPELPLQNAPEVLDASVFRSLAPPTVPDPADALGPPEPIVVAEPSAPSAPAPARATPPPPAAEAVTTMPAERPRRRVATPKW